MLIVSVQDEGGMVFGGSAKEMGVVDAMGSKGACVHIPIVTWHGARCHDFFYDVHMRKGIYWLLLGWIA